jgi:hypothetical protein
MIPSSDALKSGRLSEFIEQEEAPLRSVAVATSGIVSATMRPLRSFMPMTIVLFEPLRR